MEKEMLSIEFKRGYLSSKYGVDWVKRQPVSRIVSLYAYWMENAKKDEKIKKEVEDDGSNC